MGCAGEGVEGEVGDAVCVVSVEPRVQTSKAQPAVGTAIVVLWTDWLA